MTNVCSLRLYFIHIFVSYLSLTTSIGIISPFNCRKGCRNDIQCPKNGHCVIVASNCGICLCNEGFVAFGNSCKDPNAKQQSKNSTKKKQSLPTSKSPFSNIQSTTVWFAPAKVTPAPKSAAGPPDPSFVQGSPPKPEPIECNQYDCGVEPESGNDAQPLKIRSQKVPASPVGCKNKIINDKTVCKSPLPNGSTNCLGVYCLDVTSDKSFCICPYHKVGEGCQESKPGRCSAASGDVPSNGYISTDKRFYHNEKPDQGDIISRHFALNLAECIKLCQWTVGKCRSVNFGPINDQKVCELLSVQIGKRSTLEQWIKSEPGWTYACCFTTL